MYAKMCTHYIITYIQLSKTIFHHICVTQLYNNTIMIILPVYVCVFVRVRKPLRNIDFVVVDLPRLALDVVLYDAHFAGMKLAGIVLIAIGFFLVMFPNNWPDYITRLIR